VSPGESTARPILVIEPAAIVFDNDGVLVDSAASVDRAWARWAEAQGVDLADVLAIAHARRSRDTVAALIPEPRREAALALIDALEIDDAASVRAVPGAVELVGGLPRHRWAVVTSGTLALASARLAAAGVPLPDVLVTADDVQRGKPDPEGYALALRRLGVAGVDAVVLEDGSSGVAAARAAGVGTVIGVGERVSRADVTVVVPDLQALSWDGARLRVTG
jgi:sugar-phosphatase